LILDGFQAGLSWLTILKKIDNFRNAFAGFDPNIIASWGEEDVARLLQDAGIMRNRGKSKHP
jgi:DNA-3-methyladenine glycosylase I